MDYGLVFTGLGGLLGLLLVFTLIRAVFRTANACEEIWRKSEEQRALLEQLVTSVEQGNERQAKLLKDAVRRIGEQRGT